MTALNTFQFGGYALRPATGDDAELAHAWTQADAEHRENTAAAFWTEQGLGCDSYLLSDPISPIFFFKMVRFSEHVVELHIQFMPETGPRDHERTREGLLQGFEWLERVCRLSGVKCIAFDTRNAMLRKFAIKRLGFEVLAEAGITTTLGKQISTEGGA